MSNVPSLSYPRIADPRKTIYPFAMQVRAHELMQQNVQILYGGAIRGGKTYWLLLELYSLAMEFPNSRWLIMRSDMPRFTQTTMRTFEEFLESGFKYNVQRWHKGTNTVTWKNGSQFIFMAENYAKDKELNRFKGLEINGAGLDEVNELQEVTYDKVIERAGSWFHARPNRWLQPCPIKILSTCNPSNNWVKTRFYDKWKKGPGHLPKGTCYIPSKITDNPHVPAAYLESLAQNMPREKYIRFVEGDWEYTERTGKEWVYDFDYLKHTAHVPYIKGYPVKLSFDFNLKPYTTMLAAQVVIIDKTVWFRIFKEYTLAVPNNNPEACIAKFEYEYIKKYGFTTVDVFGDASGRHGYDAFRGIFAALEKYLHNHSDQVGKSNPLVEHARDLMNEIFGEKYDIRIVVDRDKCPNLIKDLDTLQEGITGFDPEKVDKVETKGHCYSALVYLVCQVFRDLLKSRK